MIEFGAIYYNAQTLQPIKRYHTMIHCPVKVTKKATDVHGITNQMLKNAPKFEDVANDIFSLLDGVVWVAHNLPFDAKRVKAEFERLSRPPPVPFDSFFISFFLFSFFFFLFFFSFSFFFSLFLPNFFYLPF